MTIALRRDGSRCNYVDKRSRQLSFHTCDVAVAWNQAGQSPIIRCGDVINYASISHSAVWIVMPWVGHSAESEKVWLNGCHTRIAHGLTIIQESWVLNNTRSESRAYYINIGGIQTARTTDKVWGNKGSAIKACGGECMRVIDTRWGERISSFSGMRTGMS